MNRFIALRKPPDQTITATISALTQEHVEQISDFWRAILRATQQPDEGWDWAYKLRLSLNDDRYDSTLAISAKGQSAKDEETGAKPDQPGRLSSSVM